MKKNYFFLFVCLMLTLVAGNAMAESITDVYGKYTFTATMTVASGQDASKFSDDCEVTISKASSNYLAYITGIAGCTNDSHAVSYYEDGKLKIINIGSCFSGQMYFSYPSEESPTTKGYNPFGGTQLPNWEMTVDPVTGTITIPDFVIVKVADWEEKLSDVVVSFTDAKLTLIEREHTDIPDIKGNYTYTHGEGTYDYKSDTPFSPDYTFTLTKSDDSNKNYTATFAFDKGYTCSLNATFDGVIVSIPFDSIYFGEKKDSIRLGNINANATGEISYSYVKAGVLSAASGFSIVQDSISKELRDSTFQWFINGKAKDPSQIEGEDVNFAGTYTIEGTYFDYKDYAEKTDTFTIVIKSDDNGIYVPVFWGGDNSLYTYGGLAATVNKDNPRELDISCGVLCSSATEGNYYYCADMNVDESSYITFTLNTDGTYSLGAFMIIDKAWKATTSSANYYRYYSSSKVTGIDDIKAAATTATGMYDLNGRKATGTGLRVANGKVVFVK